MVGPLIMKKSTSWLGPCRWCPAFESAPSTRVCSACGSPAPRAPRPRRRSAQVLCTGGGRARRSGSGPRLVLAWRGGGCRGRRRRCSLGCRERRTGVDGWGGKIGVLWSELEWNGARWIFSSIGPIYLLNH